jgi:hypothetical protein
MARFEADEEGERVTLVADAVAAHRERDSAFCTLEADDDPSDDPEFLPPWVQFAEGTLNLDCTRQELDALNDVLGRYGAFTVTERTTVDPETEGESPATNVRVNADADDERVGQFVEAVFRAVYDLPATYRLWAVEV